MRAAWQRLGQFIDAVAGWRGFKPLVFLACAGPLLMLAWKTWQLFSGADPDVLGADPAKELLHETGETALLLLLLSLTVTPVRRLFGANRVQRVRRMLGVWSFAYALTHLSVYLVFDQLCYSASTCQFNAIWQDILKRRFIFVGQLSFVCLLLLALTSTTGWVRRLKKNWARLHRLAYVAAIAGIVHFVWIQKSDITEPLKWAFWLGVLLAVRVYFSLAKRRSAAPARAVTPSRP
jgi:sulfoxide reductase heme-binding subunit YedZ